MKPLPSLQTLILHDILHEGGIWGLLNTLALPGLRQLQIPDQHLTVERLATCLAKSGCSLQKLCITDSHRPITFYRESFPSVASFLLDHKLDSVELAFREGDIEELDTSDGELELDPSEDSEDGQDDHSDG